MADFAWYLIASGLTLGILLLAHQIVLAKLTHFQWNRIYLLASLGIALVAPAIVLQGDFVTSSFSDYEFLFPGDEPVTPTLHSSPLVGMPGIPWMETSPFSGMEEALQTHTPNPSESLFSLGMWSLVLGSIYFLGLAIGVWRLSRGIYKVWSMYRFSPQETTPDYTVLYPQQLKASFSFFKWVFIAPQDRHAAHRAVLEAHESVHIQQGHSLDALLAEFACKFWWFLPWLPHYRKSLKTTHEFLADQAAARINGKKRYSKVLLQSAIATPSLPVHYFAQSKIQQRILMLNKSTSKRRSRWAYLIVAPLLIASFFVAIYLPLPANGPETAAEEVEVKVKTPTLAGEALPSDPIFVKGLQSMVSKIKSKPNYCQKIWLRGQRYAEQIREFLQHENVPADFLYLAMAESGFDPEAMSSTGAGGVWQFMPETARSYGLTVSDDQDDRKDLALSTRAAAQYLRKYKDRFGTWTSAALAYNRGPGALKKGNVTTSIASCYEFDHEQGYLYRVLAMKQLFEDPASFGLTQQQAFVLPLKHYAGVNSHFGHVRSPFGGEPKQHTGADFKSRSGNPVLAIGDGVVGETELSDEGRGNRIKLEHAGSLSSHYNHLRTIQVKPGQKIKAGDVIGTVGNTGRSTGPHLHLEIREKDKPVNPNLYLKL